MISFRFHVVSLVAVFLALGLGVLTGTTVLNRGIVSQLENRTDDLAAEAQGLRDQVSDLQAEVDSWGAFGEEVMGFVVGGRLPEDRVVVVTQEGTDDATIGAVRRALDEAGAEIDGLLAVSERMALSDDTSRADLADIVGAADTDDPEVLNEEAAESLAARLSFGPSGPDILEALIDAGFVVVRRQEPTSPDELSLRSLGGNGEIVVVVAGGRERPAVDPERFLVPLVRQLAEDGVPVAAAESLDSRYPFVTVLRSDGSVDDRIVTQDNVDQIPGEIGLVLALEDLQQGTPGHYGVKDGASGLIPEP